MKLVGPFQSMYQKMRSSIRGWGIRTYAIVVASEYADDFGIPGTEICDRWDNGEESVIFVVQSKKELRGLSEIVKGVIGITRM